MEKEAAAFVEPRSNTGEWPIRVVLTELFAQYERRFPGANIAVLETPPLPRGIQLPPGRPTVCR
jgi:hypothetical protein